MRSNATVATRLASDWGAERELNERAVRGREKREKRGLLVGLAAVPGLASTDMTLPSCPLSVLRGAQSGAVQMRAEAS